MATSATSLKRILGILKTHYGAPAPPRVTDPFGMVLWENIAYLVDDERREKIFADLRKTVGVQPAEIMNATIDELYKAIRSGGSGYQQRAARLKECALIALNEFGGDLRLVLQLTYPKAIKALRQFPAIGEPGAEKILLLTKTQPVLALDSNGLRVMLRLGFGEEKKNYSASYKSVREAIADQRGTDCDFLIVAHQLLRQHGKTLCKASKPRCAQCPLTRDCRFFQNK